jgi:hypothetical protein
MSRLFRTVSPFTGFALGALAALIVDRTLLKHVAKNVVRGALMVKDNVDSIKAEILEELQDEQAAKKAGATTTTAS